MKRDRQPIRASTLARDDRQAVVDPVALVTDEVRERYRTDGVVVLRNALAPDWMLLLELGLQRVLRTAERHRFFAGEPGEFVETLRSFDDIPEIKRLLYDSPIADVVGALIGSENVWYYSDEWFIKEGGNCRRTPWHQDLPYWPLEGDQIASMWITLDPLTADECLEYVRGSHRGVMFDGFDPARVSEDPTLPHYGRDLPPLPDIEADRASFDIVSWDLAVGDVILAHPGALHGGGPTGPEGRRRAITIRLYGDDIVYATRPPTRPTVPLTPGLAQSLSPGDKLRSPWYPRLRPVPGAVRALWV